MRKWVGTRSQAIYTGDSFTLTVLFTQPLTPAFARDASNPREVPCSSGGRPTIGDLNISWSETAGNLTPVVINIDGVTGSIGGLAGRGAFVLSGGPLASDGALGGCANT